MAKDIGIEELRKVVERLHGCSASWLKPKLVQETFQSQTVWGGMVHGFEPKGHSAGTRCYAWSAPIEGSNKRRFFAVLHLPPVTSAIDAACGYCREIQEAIRSRARLTDEPSKEDTTLTARSG